jgi:hypothetical protein
LDGGTLSVLLDAPLDDRKTGDQPNDRTDIPIGELQDRVRCLEEANRENRRIIAALTSRIPAIEAPHEPPDPPETSEEEPRRAEPRPAAGEAQEGSNGSKVDVVSDNVQFLDG